MASTRNSRNVKLYWGSVSKNWSSAWLVTIKLLNSLCQTQWITLFPSSSASSPPKPAPPANTWCWVHSMRLWHVEPWPGVGANGQLLAPANSNWSWASSWNRWNQRKLKLLSWWGQPLTLSGFSYRHPQEKWGPLPTIMKNHLTEFIQPTSQPWKSPPKSFPPHKVRPPRTQFASQPIAERVVFAQPSWKFLQHLVSRGVEVGEFWSWSAETNWTKTGGRGGFSPRHLEMSFPNEKVTTCEWRKSWFWILLAIP